MKWNVKNPQKKKKFEFLNAAKNRRKEGSWSFKHELARKFIHFFSVLLIIIYFLIEKYYNKSAALLALTFILAVFLTFEYLRLDVKRNIPILTKIWGYVRRKKEKNRLGADIFILIGSIIVLAVFLQELR